MVAPSEGRPASHPAGSEEMRAWDSVVGLEDGGVAAVAEPDGDVGPVDPEQATPINDSASSSPPLRPNALILCSLELYARAQERAALHSLR
jgi:hypothetical protein